MMFLVIWKKNDTVEERKIKSNKNFSALQQQQQQQQKNAPDQRQNVVYFLLLY